MRFVSFAVCLSWLTIFVPSSVNAQNTVPADKPESSTGPTLTPETKGQGVAPQGIGWVQLRQQLPQQVTN